MVNYILSFHPSSPEIILHLQPQFSMCPFCSMNFTMYSRVEQLDDDSEFIFRQAKISEKKVKNLISGKRRWKSFERDLLFWKHISKNDVRELYEWYFDDFLAFGYTIEEYFKKIGLDNLSD